MSARKPLTKDSLHISRPSITLREIVLDKLREAIMNFQLEPGERLVERDLCERLGVSRTSVREALRSLQSEGLVEQQTNGRGPRVAVITLDEARDLYELRCSLESMVIQLFTQKATDAQMAQLNAAWEALKEQLDKGQTVPIVRAVSILYGILYEGAGNQEAGRIILQLQARLNSLRVTTTSQPGRYKESYKEMTRIMEAIQTRDVAKAYEASVDHITKASEIALMLLAKREKREVPTINPPMISNYTKSPM